jgi:hypothetical protein
MNAPDAIDALSDKNDTPMDALRRVLKCAETLAAKEDEHFQACLADDARAILDHITALTAERDAAVSELRGIARSTGCVDACPCWAKLRRKAQHAIAAGAHLKA